MSYDLSPYRGGDLLPRDTRRASRSISRSQIASAVRIAAVNSETDVALSKVEDVTTATGQAMGAVVRVAQVQRQLETLAPEAAGRLAFLADSHLLAMSDIVTDLHRDLRRK